MIDLEIWRTEAAGVLAAESSDLRLIVQAPKEVGGAVRFLVLRRGEAGAPDSILGSGTRNDVLAAMTAAAQVAERCARLGLLETAVQP